MSLWVLFDNVTNVVRFPCLLKLSSCDKILDLSNRTNGIFVCLCQTIKNMIFSINEYAWYLRLLVNYKNYYGNILPCNLIGFIIKILFAVLIIIHWSSVRHTTQRRKEIFCSNKSRITPTFWLSFRGRNVSKGLLPSPSLICASSYETKSGPLRWLPSYMNPGIQYNL